MSNQIKILVDFRNGVEYRNFKISVGRETTVGHLLFKMRHYMKIKPETAVFCFFQSPAVFLGQTYGKKEKLYNNSILLTEIQQELCQEILEVKLLLESTFGTLESRFISAEIKEHVNGVWVLILEYSYYSIYSFKETYVCKSMQDAIYKLALERCSKLEIKDKNNTVVDIKPE